MMVASYTTRGDTMQQQSVATAIVVHGGAGSGKELADGCQQAAEAGASRLAQGEDGLAAAIAAVVSMEDDGRFNAGTGAALGLDGVTVEMDAAVMDTRGRLSAVAALRAVKNPILVARDIARTPHYLLANVGDQGVSMDRQGNGSASGSPCAAVSS
jgi:L-asparaginase/beta-aspartyl-peptidase (threonine type)